MVCLAKHVALSADHQTTGAQITAQLNHNFFSLVFNRQHHHHCQHHHHHQHHCQRHHHHYYLSFATYCYTDKQVSSEQATGTHWAVSKGLILTKLPLPGARSVNLPVQSSIQLFQDVAASSPVHLLLHPPPPPPLMFTSSCLLPKTASLLPTFSPIWKKSLFPTT